VALVARVAYPPLRKLRVGLFADAPLQPRWVIDAFARVAASEFATVAALAIVGGGKRVPWPVGAYARLDRRVFGAEPNEALALAQHVPHERFVPALSEADLAALDLDVAFAIGDSDHRALAAVARYGMWRFCFGANHADPAALAGFGEVARGEPLSASGLEVCLPGEAPRLAYRSWSRTFPHSVARNRAQLLPKTGEFIYRALRELHRSGPGWLEQCPGDEAAAHARAAPTNSRLLLDLGRIGVRILKRARVRALYTEQWFFAFRYGMAQGHGVPADLAGFTPLVPPKDRDWADPFALERNGRHYVFFEELPYASGKAHISMIEIGPNGRRSPPVRVLERDYHLSYPFLLEHDGALYMIPESAQNRSVELYRCIDFPSRWRLERVLLEGVRCVDATLHRAGDRWWMFANAAVGESDYFDDELHLFHAEHLTGDWKPHPRNPVKSDPRGARPAGRLYHHGNVLYRPAQICVPRYGAGLSINRVQRLTRQEYAEQQVQCILPAEKDGILGLHTVNRAGALTVVDAFTRRARV
jgi:hypothetical protein